MTPVDSRPAGRPPSAKRVLGLSMLAVFATSACTFGWTLLG